MCCRVNVSARHVQTISTIMLTRRLESSQLAWWLVGFLATSLKTWSKCGRLCSISRGEPGCRCRCRPVPIFGGSTAGAAVVDRTGVPCALRRSSSSSDLRSCTGERSCSSGSCRFARIQGDRAVSESARRVGQHAQARQQKATHDVGAGQMGRDQPARGAELLDIMRRGCRGSSGKGWLHLQR